MEGIEIVNYACQKFQEQKYDEALEAFILAYSKGYACEWIIENIYACYMDGNESDFRTAFQKCLQDKVNYEECLLDFVPYKDGEYYIYDKQRAQFCGRFSYCDLEYVQPDPAIDGMEFSAILLEFDWNWNHIMRLLAEAKRRKIYVICHDMARCISFCKIPELSNYFENIVFFSSRQALLEYFHQHTDVYLPQMVYGDDEAKEKLEQILEGEHTYRLTPEGRNTENVLLTIAIPTANRGNLVVKRLKNLLSMHFDAEIEIVVSKNGVLLYEDEYHQISEIEDARFVYHDHGRILKAYENWYHAVTMAHGKYVMFVSDEDDVILSELEHYLSILTYYPHVSILRAKSSFQGLKIDERVYAKKGSEAFTKCFLNQNYLSGLTVRRSDFLEVDVLQYERYADNEFYRRYPHEWWCAALCKRGDYMAEPVLLILENDSVLEQEIDKFKEMKILPEDTDVIQNNGLPVYATYSERLKQLEGQADFLHIFEQEHIVDLVNNLYMAITKTGYFLGLARRYDYNIQEFVDYVNRYVTLCHGIIEQFTLDDQGKTILLAYVRKQEEKLLKLHQDLNEEKDVDNETL